MFSGIVKDFRLYSQKVFSNQQADAAVLPVLPSTNHVGLAETPGPAPPDLLHHYGIVSPIQSSLG
jgi:hypothetical protein